ncbi:MAG: glycosyltransferase family 4 protein [Bacteroidetes bacterium]|nr:glycosyltransferase family 4 protein [Bacteroidota bacterium]
MRIGFDAKRYVHNQKGLGNYSRSLVHSLSTHFPDHDFVLFNRDLPSEIPSTQSNISFKTAKGKKLFWRQVGITASIEAANLDVYHGLSAELPMLRPRQTKLVVTVHDLIFLKYPSYYSFWDRLIYLYKLRNALRMANVVICTSEVTRQDIQAMLPVHSNKLVVIGQPCDEAFYHRSNRENLDQFRKQYNLPNAFLLCVSSFEKRKNHLRLIKAWQDLSIIDKLPLVLVGKPGDALNAVRQVVEQSGNDIQLITDASPEHLKLFYEASTAVVLPSEYEGFGIPALEAMACGKPVLTGTNTSMEEVTGSSKYFFNPLDESSISASLEALHHEEVRNELRNAQQQRLPLYDANTIAKEHINLYQSVSTR